MRIISTKAPLVDKRRSCNEKIAGWKYDIFIFDNGYFAEYYVNEKSLIIFSA